MQTPEVTIVIATYNRPDVLRMAIFSVIQQTIKNWKLYVIGDNCDERTEAVVNEFQDNRITFINLKDRFGEQSGPNSIGIAITQSKYIAFLNHDDVWLKDHLELGLEILNQKQYNFYFGGVANSAFLEKNETGLKIHVDRITLNNRKPSDFFKRLVLSYEPASSWIIETSFVKQLGYWNYFDELYRVPIEDYALRAWRNGAKFYFSKTISVWYVLTQYQKKGNQKSYEYQSEEHHLIKELITSKNADELRKYLIQNHEEWKSVDPIKQANLIHQTTFSKNGKKEHSFRDKLYLWRTNALNNLIFSTTSAYIYKITGIDLFVIYSKLKRNPKGAVINAAILKRTGERPPKPNKKEVIERVKIDLELD